LTLTHGKTLETVEFTVLAEAEAMADFVAVLELIEIGGKIESNGVGSFEDQLADCGLGRESALLQSFFSKDRVDVFRVFDRANTMFGDFWDNKHPDMTTDILAGDFGDDSEFQERANEIRSQTSGWSTTRRFQRDGGIITRVVEPTPSTSPPFLGFRRGIDLGERVKI
jgi:hypothetical protein